MTSGQQAPKHVHDRLYLCRITSLADFSLSLDKVAAAMQKFISGSPLTNSLCWPYAFSHLDRPAAPQTCDAALDAKASNRQAAAGSDFVYELTQQWIHGVVERTTRIICTLHQA